MSSFVQPNTSQPDRIFVQPPDPQPPRLDTLKVPPNDARIVVNSDDIKSAKILYADGTQQELTEGANNARVGVYDPKHAGSDKDVLVILTAAGAGGGLLATVFGLARSDDSSGAETPTTPPSLKGPDLTAAPTAPPSLKSYDLGIVPVDGSSIAVSAEGTNLLGADPAQAASFLESDSKVVYPNLEVRSNSQVVTVYDRALEPADIGKSYTYKVRTSEGETRADMTTAGLSGATAQPPKIAKGQVATVYVDRAGFAKLPADTRITFKLQPSPNARLVSPSTIETTKAALEVSNYAVGQVTGLAEGELVVKVEAQFPDIKRLEFKNYSAPLPAETLRKPVE